MRKITMAVALLLALCAAAGCSDHGAEREAAVRAAAAARAARLIYDREILDWRAARLQQLTRPDGSLSLVGMHWLAEGSTRIGRAADNGTRLAVGPDHLGVLKVGHDGSLQFTADPGAGATVNGADATGAMTLVSDADPKNDASVVAFNKGDASFIVVKLGARFALRVRDALAPTRTGFAGIPSFAIDPGFRFKASFKPHAAGQTIAITNVLGLVDAMANPGTVTFIKGGKAFTLEAVDEGDHRLFLVFADGTSGHQSYAASRVLYADYPDASGHTIVDFNKGYSPPCAFTDFSNCLLPPPSNRLDLAITAGEMKPRKANGTAPH